MTNRVQAENDFSISQGGFVKRALMKLNLDLHRWRLAIILLCITWLPVTIITAIEGTLFGGTQMPFLEDVVMQGRLLLGIPLLAVIGKKVYRNTPAVMQYLTDVLMPAEDRESFMNGALQKAKKNTNSNWVEIIILLLVIGFALGNAAGVSLFIDSGNSASWMRAGSEGKQVLSFAGKWVLYISLPIFQFLLLRWLWRYITWIVLLYRISKGRLNLQPTHPDGAGGLGVLLIAQRNFIMLFVACGIVISCGMIARLLVEDNFFETIKVEITGYIIFSMLMLLFPLFFFSSKLVRTKINGQLNLSKAGTNLSKQFEGDFVHPLATNNSLTDNTVDPSMQIDYSGVYTNLQALRIVPVTFIDVVYFAIMLFVPFIPIFFIHFSIVELLQKLMGLLV